MSTRSTRSSRRFAFVVALGTLMAGAISLHAVVTALKITVKKIPIEAKYKLPSLPETLPSWKSVGVDEKMTAEMVEELGTENYISRVYVEKDPPKDRQPLVLSLHCAYYTGMIDTVPHVPDRCLVGAGWSIASAGQVLPLNLDPEVGQWRLEKDISTADQRVFSARLGPDSKAPNTRINLPRNADEIAMRVNAYSEPKSSKKLYAGYFFIANGGHCADANDVRLLAFRLQDTYAYYLKVQVSTTSVENEAEYVSACRGILGELLPEIMLCAPDWVELQRNIAAGKDPRASGGSRP
ncbi:MAG: exosortase-associated EpsI family protein [Phycisphaerales bacterium]|nr:exosortase-associated EpsI family protein [Phycisphaerales bacterium]